MEQNDKHIRKSLYTNDCIQGFYNMFIKMHKVHYNNEIVEKFHTNMAGKTLCTYVLMSKEQK